MDKRDKDSGLTDQEYRDGLHLAELARHGGWSVFKSFCELYVNDNKNILFNNVEGQLNDAYYRGCGKGVEELLTLLKTRIELALAQEQRELEANSAGEKENNNAT